MKLLSRDSRYAVLFGAAMSLSLTASAAPFTNGSFENPGINNFGNFLAITAPDLAPTGWVGGALKDVALFYEKTGFFNVVAKDGSYLVGFGGSSSSGATLSQTFDTVAGAIYTVDFFITAQQVGTGPQSYRVDALNDNSVINSVSGDIPAKAEWNPHSLSFTAGSLSSTIRFTDTSNGPAAANINWALDAVSVTSVPEPESWALMGAGLALLGFAGRSRPIAV